MYLSILNEHMILIEFVVIDVMQLMALTQNHFLKKISIVELKCSK
jgi:hypothetical protein